MNEVVLSKTCEFCNNKFYRRNIQGHLISIGKWNARRFCSNQCRGKHTRMLSDQVRPFKRCDFCGKSYSKPIDSDDKSWGKRKFCSRSCWLVWRVERSQSKTRESKKCELCERVFYRNQYPINDESWNNRRFCSVKCWHKSPEGKDEHIKAYDGKRAWTRAHPDLVFAIGQKAGAAASRWVKSHPEIATQNGKRQGRIAVETGQIFEIPKSKVTYGVCGIDNHKHRSKLEVNTCRGLQRIYSKDVLHSNVRLKRVELDFVIGKDPHAIETWIKVIEPHVIRYWETPPEPANYKELRINELRELGVKCPIEVIIK